jgi:FeS assembly SUF system regulator
MIRLSKLTDYGFVLLTRFGDNSDKKWLTARDLAETTGLPLPTVSKLLKTFSKGGMLQAHRGANGGYSLARPASMITAADVIEAVDGPLGITDCACGDHKDNVCAIEEHCPTKPHWVRISRKIRDALTDVTLLELSQSVPSETSAPAHSSVCRGDGCNTRPDRGCTCGEHQTHFSGDKK